MCVREEVMMKWKSCTVIWY